MRTLIVGALCLFVFWIQFKVPTVLFSHGRPTEFLTLEESQMIARTPDGIYFKDKGKKKMKGEYKVFVPWSNIASITEPF